MPTYQYECAECRFSVDVVRGILEDTPDPFCESCNSALKRVYSNIGVTFRGSGFYSTEK